MLDDKGLPARAFRVGDVTKIYCKLVFREAMDNPTVGILIKDRLGNDVFGTNTFHLNTDNNDLSLP